MINQRTIKDKITLTGKGLHLGEETTLVLKPAPANHGIVFVRTDINGGHAIPVGQHTLHHEDIARCSVIHCDGVRISTLEHLMAALSGLGIDNIVVEINHEEVPGLDGSAQDFVCAIDQVGVVELDASKEFIEVTAPIKLELNEATITIEPDDHFSINYTLDYDHPLLKQQVTFVIDEQTFRDDIAQSRTFCLEKEKEWLVNQGLGKGANYHNTLVIGDVGPIDNSFRYPDECARHKVLDCIGDLYLLGKAIKGRVTAVKSGHALNNRLVQAVFQQQNCSTVL